ncbi:unnamed protein product [Ilex paraguariensis]|uniref:F-box domain-containing protein n=1 Tax=Ilex paraguariensis TaxID=185542 RepID=A0ABC8RXJ5_9AQUA
MDLPKAKGNPSKGVNRPLFSLLSCSSRIRKEVGSPMDDLSMAMKKLNHDHGLSICLSDDFVFDHILTRLPVKSLFQFRCVSKSWCYFLTHINPSFIDLHLSRSHSRLAGNATLLFPAHDKKSRHDYLFLAGLDGGGKVTQLSSLPVEDEYFGLSENINGLVCWHHLSDTEKIKCAYICNPSTHELVKLPIIPLNDMRYEKYFSFTFDFGFDPSSEEFKVIRLPYSSHGAFHIFTLGGNSWRQIEPALPSSFREHKWENCVLQWCIALGVEGREDYSGFRFERGEVSCSSAPVFHMTAINTIVVVIHHNNHYFLAPPLLSITSHPTIIGA